MVRLKSWGKGSLKGSKKQFRLPFGFPKGKEKANTVHRPNQSEIRFTGRVGKPGQKTMTSVEIQLGVPQRSQCGSAHCGKKGGGKLTSGLNLKVSKTSQNQRGITVFNTKKNGREEKKKDY